MRSNAALTKNRAEDSTNHGGVRVRVSAEQRRVRDGNRYDVSPRAVDGAARAEARTVTPDEDERVDAVEGAALGDFDDFVFDFLAFVARDEGEDVALQPGFLGEVVVAADEVGEEGFDFFERSGDFGEGFGEIEVDQICFYG